MINAIAPVTPTLLATELSPSGVRADAVTIATVIGFAPSFLVDSPAAVIYQAVNANPNAVSEAAKIARTVQVGERAPSFIDRYA